MAEEHPTLPDMLRATADEIEHSGTASSTPPCFALMYEHAGGRVLIGTRHEIAQLYAALSLMGHDDGEGLTRH